jgi:hypothetical protein
MLQTFTLAPRQTKSRWCGGGLVVQLQRSPPALLPLAVQLQHSPPALLPLAVQQQHSPPALLPLAVQLQHSPPAVLPLRGLLLLMGLVNLVQGEVVVRHNMTVVVATIIIQSVSRCVSMYMGMFLHGPFIN